MSQRVEVTVQGRERVTLQRTLTLPEGELAPFHHHQAGLTLVNFSAQLKRILRDSGAFTGCLRGV
jgi:hypothetical protein